MEPIVSLVSQLKSVAMQIKGKINNLDAQLADAYSQREKLTRSTVTKKDFIAYVSEDIRRKGIPFEQAMLRNIGGLRREYAAFEPFASGRVKTLGMLYLNTDRASPFVISEDAIFFFFGDTMAKRMGEAIAALPWPGDMMPVAEIKIALGLVDAEIGNLKRERNELVAQLTDAGLSG